MEDAFTEPVAVSVVLDRCCPISHHLKRDVSPNIKNIGPADSYLCGKKEGGSGKENFGGIFTYFGQGFFRCPAGIDDARVSFNIAVRTSDFGTIGRDRFRNSTQDIKPFISLIGLVDVFNDAVRPDAERGRLPYILNRDVALNSMGGDPKVAVPTRNVGADLSLTNISGILSHFLSGFERLPHKNDTERSNRRHYYSGYKHPKRPERHFSLSFKVILSALMFICGCYYFSYAFRNISTLTSQAGTAYLIGGMAGIAAGVMGVLGFGFSQF